MINFLKKNWIWILLVIIGLFLWNRREEYGRSTVGGPSFEASSNQSSTYLMSDLSLGQKTVAPSETSNRVVIQDTGLSLQVKDVSKSIKEIERTTQELGGFLVRSYLSKPESAASGNISVRVPEEKRAEAMEAFKKGAVKVVSESVSGSDVTDEYTDLQAQLEVLEKTKAKFEEILNQAVEVKDLLAVQKELISTQKQIDSVKGQQKFYEQSAKLSKITVYLSTDDLALPYAPDNEWRPKVVFKEAVRSLIRTVRDLGSLLIWLVVFSPIIIPVILIIRYFKKRQKKSLSTPL
jgi:hypothetical protein